MKKSSAKSVGSYVPAVAKAAFEAHGFPSAAIVADWPAIAGVELAAFTAPEKLIWPRRRKQAGGDVPARGSKSRRPEGATLLLRVDGPRALEVQHAIPQIIERVNTYFGYGAVTSLRIVQAPVRRGADEAPARPAPEPETVPSGDPALAEIGDEDLRAALARLSARID